MAQFDVYRFDMQFQLGLTKASTSWYYRQAQADTSGSADIAVALSTPLVLELWTNWLKTVVSLEVSMIQTKCQLYAPTKGTPDRVIDAPSFGDALGSRLSNAEAVVVSKYPTSWNRNFICRNYYPGWDEDDFTGSRMQAAVQTAAQALATTQELKTISIVSPENLDFDQVCFSQTLWKAFNPATGDVRDVYSILGSVDVQPVLGTQRRRRPPRGAGPAV